MDKDLFNKFKELTGYTQTEIAEQFGMTRQNVSLMKRNYGFAAKTSFAFMLNLMIDQKIKELALQIFNLEELQGLISESALNQEAENDNRTTKD